MIGKIKVGIDVGTSQVKVVVAEQLSHDGRVTLKILGCGKAESRGMRHGYVLNPLEASESIRLAVKQAEKMANLKISSAYLSVGGIGLEDIISEHAMIISRPEAEINHTDLEQVLERAENALPDSLLMNRRILHAIPLGYKIDGKDVLGRPLGVRGMKLEVRTLFVTCLNSHLIDLVQAVEEAGVEILDVMAEPLAASLSAINKSQKKAGCILVNIGAETVSLAVFEENVPLSLKIFPIGSIDITNDLALSLQISLEEAEKAKLGGTTKHPRKKIDQIIQSKTSDILNLIEGHLKKIGKNGLLPAGAIIAGGGSKILNITESAKKILKLPAKVAQLNFMPENKVQLPDSSWAASYGLCFLGIENGDKREQSIRITTPNGKKMLTAGFNWVKKFLP